ncbi:hypothetical protein ERY430_70139 [Erythrobacter sp. EC-HK427]|nr:hypothetical protein ERY430_70139 [Erythrobacter sp. EC-HK427]
MRAHPASSAGLAMTYEMSVNFTPAYKAMHHRRGSQLW